MGIHVYRLVNGSVPADIRKNLLPLQKVFGGILTPPYRSIIIAYHPHLNTVLICSRYENLPVSIPLKWRLMYM